KDLILPNEKKLYIFVTHDECLFYANDDHPIIWAPLGEPPHHKKGQGKSIMEKMKKNGEQQNIYLNK
ncbi:hypothetical protein C1646_703066, partial [Rhizophagus diaphanus]